MIAIIDYDAGNMKSVEKAMQYLGQDVVMSRDTDTLLQADKVILPGVGAFGAAMERIRAYGLEALIHQIVSNRTPFLGICLGMQLMFEGSEESPGVDGLGLIKGKILRIPDTEGLKVPNIGWNSLVYPNQGKLFEGIEEGAYVYFVHSYYLKAEDEKIVTATTDYGTTVHASVEKGNLYGCQFHPEKSSDVGLQILKNFIKL